jgi:hypothetical protein
MTTTEQDIRRDQLEQRVQQFHGVDLDRVLEVIDYLREADDSALVGGSLAYGLGNGRSDLDIVLAGPSTKESSSRMPLEHFVESLRVDVWKLRAEEIDELFERAQAALAGEAPFAGSFGNVFEQADLKLLHRMAYGIVVDGPPLEPAGTRNYRDIARDLLVREYAERMRQSFYVAQLALAAGEHVAGVMNARFGIEEALQATLAARGLPFSDNKWLQVRLHQDAPDLQAVYAPFAILPPAAAEAPGFAAAALAAAEGLLGIDLAVATLAPHAEWQNTDLRMMAAGEVRLLVSPKQGVIWEFDQQDAQAWASLGEAEAWSCAGCDEAQMQLCFHLYRHGVMALGWTRGVPLRELRINGEGSA